jgi:hypothetical protein
MPADVDALVTVVVVAVAAAAADDDGATEKLKPLVEAAGNNDPDVAEAEVADGAVDAPVAETEAIVGVEADEDEPKEKPDVVADELPAAVVLENSEGAGEACEVAKERLVAGEDTEVVGVADVLLAKAKAGAVEAEENKEAAVFPVAELAVDGVKPKDGGYCCWRGREAKGWRGGCSRRWRRGGGRTEEWRRGGGSEQRRASGASKP